MSDFGLIWRLFREYFQIKNFFQNSVTFLPLLSSNFMQKSPEKSLEPFLKKLRYQPTNQPPSANLETLSQIPPNQDIFQNSGSVTFLPLCVSGVKQCLLFVKFGIFCFLVTSVVVFAFLPYHQRDRIVNWFLAMFPFYTSILYYLWFSGPFRDITWENRNRLIRKQVGKIQNISLNWQRQ